MASLYTRTADNGDIVLVRTGFLAQGRARKNWGTYASGDAPRMDFWTCGWIQSHQVAGVATDTWGCEVRPNELTALHQPWHSPKPLGALP